MGNLLSLPLERPFMIDGTTRSLESTAFRGAHFEPKEGQDSVTSYQAVRAPSEEF